MVARIDAAASAGFSLIELLLVVAAISILTIGVGLSVGRRGPAEPGDAAVLLRLDAAARSDALLRRQVQALLVNAEGVSRAQRRDGSWQEGGELRQWQGNTRWARPAPPAEQVIAYLPDGRSTPFEVEFRDGPTSLRCVSDGWTAPRCARP